MNRYDNYKDTRIDWIGEIPVDWEFRKLKNFFEYKKGSMGQKLTLTFLSENIDEFPVYSGQTENNGILGTWSEHEFNFDDGVIFCTTVGAKLMTTRVVSGKFSLSQNCLIMIPKNKFILSKYINYFFNYDFEVRRQLLPSILQPSLRMEDLDQYWIPVPPIGEQRLITRYLDKKTEQIDSLIEKIKKKIELLKEQRTSSINQCVTKGLDPNVEMKDSGVEWIGKIPKHWNLRKLKYLVSYNTDTLSDTTDPDYEFHYIEIGDVDYLDGVSVNERTTFSESPSRARRVVQPKDVIVSTVRTYLRAIGVVPEINDVICSTGFCVLRDKSGLIDQEFLSFVVKSEWFVSKVISNSDGVSYPAINSSELVEIEVTLPPLDEQKEIVVDGIKLELGKHDEIIDKELRRLDLLREYRQSLISSVVTGKVRITQEII